MAIHNRHLETGYVGLTQMVIYKVKEPWWLFVAVAGCFRVCLVVVVIPKNVSPFLTTFVVIHVISTPLSGSLSCV